jgi:hypothetical protein
MCLPNARANPACQLMVHLRDTVKAYCVCNIMTTAMALELASDRMNPNNSPHTTKVLLLPKLSDS